MREDEMREDEDTEYALSEELVKINYDGKVY